MSNLLYKEWHLAVHSVVYLFLLIGALLLVPAYPYGMIFFFGCLGLYFTSQFARENSDAFYTATLPIKKRHVVKSKCLLFVSIEIAQLIICIPFSIIRLWTLPDGNPVGIEANVAYFGTFGYELDLNKLTEEEIKEVKEQITFMKEYREVLQFGTFYRLKSPFEGNETVWMVTNEDRTLAIVGYYRVLNGVNQPYSRVRLQGLNPDMIYENVWNHTENYGDELMNYGLITSDVTAGEVPGNVTPCTDFESRIYMLKGKKVQEGR
mgnify:FL=1